MTAAEPPREAGACLRVEGLRVVRGGKAIVRGVSLEARAGEVLGLLGPSGAGKSTFFRAVAGELEAASGTVRLAGEDVTGWPLWRRARQGLGYVPQTPSVLWELTVRGNLEAFHRIVHGARPAGRSATDAAARVNLTGLMEVVAGNLSAGERRRLELARAVTRSPRVLICDEPFAGVDPQGAAHLGELLAGLARDGVAVILADHHVAEALRICTRAILLLDGEVAVTDTPDAFREHPLVQGRYLGSWQRSLPPPPPRAV